MIDLDGDLCVNDKAVPQESAGYGLRPHSSDVGTGPPWQERRGSDEVVCVGDVWMTSTEGVV